MLGALLQGAPGAMSETKRLLRDIPGRPIDDLLIRDTAQRIAQTRASEEGREGIASFLEKRAPRWRPQE
jgi:methylglutaconyl-CoA hydratase